MQRREKQDARLTSQIKIQGDVTSVNNKMAPAIAPSQWDFPIDGHRRKIKTLSLHRFTLTSKSKQLSKQCKLIIISLRLGYVH